MATSPRAPGPSRKRFALTGRTVVLDPKTHAVRGDLADVRLAEYVFAPHYAAPLVRVVARATDLRATRAADGDVLTHLPAGAGFEVLEIAGDSAWGVAPDAKLVGYLDHALLAEPS